MVRRILVPAMLCIALLLGGYGCMSKEKQNINDAALEYMEQKYGEKFEYVRPWGSSYTTPGRRQILVSCASLPNKEILVVISGDKKTESYSDNYMDLFYESQVSEYIKQVADKHFGNFAVEISIIRSPTAKGISPTTGFDEYILNENHIVDANIIIKTSDEETVREFLAELKKLGVHFSLGITITSTNERFTAQYFHDSKDVFLQRRASR
ncbi:Prokaryotic membrane lipoprotein lipid attachment site profile [Desulfitobacterium hafniense]|uniref:Prokaryotic membrane lipoprotein lipid attachment site profile n=1 Tax=Desulfitobacterium hafniense TaxID=49338 RepID=A0A098B9B5_DESHA|nr:hypothetical protein [Desulfitobacterium hafniense]CDX04957.1 Prokaryotic membrane lipoprotein lipid attachment site profile [Desulfitobacterium hafniense]